MMGGVVKMLVVCFVAGFLSKAHASQAMMAQYHEDFGSFDGNSDGLLDAYEIRVQLDNDQEENILSFFSHYDTDDSGTITFDEYLNFAISANSADQHPPPSGH
eukprot:CAMPEP_0113850716 /NCGR_PEP_ID=MMETSP0372-20130328/4092_1 /TAXON_ID=340204 /ORGANISM="Lankesteria abbotti" /LENGTH=102 /DNA_ID=CAMNT_0000821151 /DNA_START=68 /DNA_END=376 /DNA_ORIENTATION=+ /assembly_acc=CAM_ASM_000359